MTDVGVPPLEYVSIGFGARACSDARAILHRQWAVGGRQLRAWSVLYESEPITMAQLPAISTRHQQAFASAQLYWVSPEMVDLVVTAATSVPESVALLPELLPDPTGVVFFAQSVKAPPAILGTHHNEVGFEIAMIHWYPQERISPRSGRSYSEVKIDIYAHVKDIGFGYLTGVEWSWGDTLSVYRNDVSTDQQDDFLRLRALFVRSLTMAFFGLIASPGVTSTELETPDKYAIKRSAREGLNDLSDTRVIYLRSSKGETGHALGTTPYHHRWIVSGHWRSQPYGKDRAHRKPVWIAPHVKGPDGAPLLHGEKVRAVVR
jgi:hypothetical protein